MFINITAPNDLYNHTASIRTVRVFIGGGITGCPQWQNEVVAALSDVFSDRKDILVVAYNPRRPNFDVNSDVAVGQIKWERRAITDSDIMTLWFCAEQVQPICLFELGYALNTRTGRDLVVSTAPGYVRNQDVKVQSQLSGFFPAIGVSLASHINTIVHWVENHKKA